MKSKVMIKLTEFELRLFFRNFINVFFLLLFPTMMLLLFGGIYGNKPQEIYGGFGMVDVSVPAYAGMIISVTGLMNLPLTLCEYREKKILKRFKVTPISPGKVIISQLGINLVMTSLGMLFLLVVAKIVYGLKVPGNLFAIIGVFILSMLSVFSIGFLIAAVAPNMKAASAIANLVYFPMLFLTGATVPLEIMPDTMRIIARFLPVTHVVKAMQGVWLGYGISTYYSSLIILFIVAIVCYLIVLKIFRWE